jgi:hypothetical protein
MLLGSLLDHLSDWVVGGIPHSKRCLRQSDLSKMFHHKN